MTIKQMLDHNLCASVEMTCSPHILVISSSDVKTNDFKGGIAGFKHTILFTPHAVAALLRLHDEEKMLDKQPP